MHLENVSTEQAITERAQEMARRLTRPEPAVHDNTAAVKPNLVTYRHIFDHKTHKVTGSLSYRLEIDEARYAIRISFARCSASDQFSRVHARELCDRRAVDNTVRHAIVAPYNVSMDHLSNVMLAINNELIMKRSHIGENELKAIRGIIHNELMAKMSRKVFGMMGTKFGSVAQ